MSLADLIAGLDPAAGIGIAVSGGGDSMALLDMTLAAARGQRIEVATVNHGLRPGAAAEAAMVAQFCAGHGLAHQTLDWTGWDGRGNLQAEARDARYRLLAAWGLARGLSVILLGHSRDDVAETLLIRLGRAAGLDGLSQMRVQFDRHGMRFARPLLDLGRADLRDHLRSRGLAWVEDPSNDDDRYARVRARKALAALADLGIAPAMVARSAAALADARAVLDAALALAAASDLTLDHGDLILNFTAPADEIQRRLLVQALQRMGNAPWPVRHQALTGVLAQIGDGGRRTLGGCLVTAGQGRLRLAREWRAVRALVCPWDALWDGRWRLVGPGAPGMEIRALGEGIRLCPDWRAAGLPRASQMAGPAVWQDARLIAAPLAGFGPPWRAELRPHFGSFPEPH